MSSPHKSLIYIISHLLVRAKSTLVNELLKKVSDLEFSISYTTRAPRGSETNGRQYYFISRDEFEKMIREEHFSNMRRCLVTITERRAVSCSKPKDHGRDLLLDIDVQGAKQIQDKLPQAISIFILPPNRKILEETPAQAQ